MTKSGACAALGMILLTGCARSGEAADEAHSLEQVRLDTARVIGALEAPAEEVFGRLDLPVVAHDGSLLLLDIDANRVSWFSDDGRHLGSTGRRGRGPGELRGPRAAAATGTLVRVLDPPNLRITSFRMTDQGLRYEGETAWYGGNSMCDVDGRTYVQALRSDAAIHEIDGAGSTLRSFGGVPDAPLEFGPFNSVVHHQLTEGRMLCLEDPELIILMRTLEPDLYAHNSEGELVWQVQLADFRPIAFQTTGRSLTSRIDHVAGVHVGKSLTRWDDRHVLVQLEIRRDEPRPAERDFHALESRLISVADGKEVARTDRLPLIGAVRGNMLYGVENRPFPRVFVMQRRPQ